MRDKAFLQVVLFCMLNVVAVGCGGDDGSKVEADQAAAGSGNTAASNAGKKAPSRTNTTPEECVELTTEVFSDRSDAYGSDCINCLCKQNPLTLALCDDQADICWGLVGCVRASCAGQEGLDEANCAVEKCGQFIEGAGLAMGLGALLGGEACSAACPRK
jgi:hypothetical protein